MRHGRQMWEAERYREMERLEIGEWGDGESGGKRNGDKGMLEIREGRVGEAIGKM